MPGAAVEGLLELWPAEQRGAKGRIPGLFARLSVAASAAFPGHSARCPDPNAGVSRYTRGHRGGPYGPSPLSHYHLIERRTVEIHHTIEQSGFPDKRVQRLPLLVLLGKPVRRAAAAQRRRHRRPVIYGQYC